MNGLIITRTETAKEIDYLKIIRDARNLILGLYRFSVLLSFHFLADSSFNSESTTPHKLFEALNA